MPGWRVLVSMIPLSRIDLPADLIAAARRGDRDAQARIYAAVGPSTLRLIARLVPAHAAEDVFQDVLMTAFERLHEWRGPAPVGAWLRAIAVNRALSYLRSPWHRLRDWARGDADPAEEHAPWLAESMSDDPAARVDLLRLLQHLSPSTRAVLWLHEVEGYSHAEIAAATGRSPSYSKSIVARARRELRSLAAARTAPLPSRVVAP